MSFIDIDTSDAVEPTIVAAGEHKLMIADYIMGKGETSAVREDKNGNPYIMPIFELADEPTAKTITCYIPLPHDGMKEKEKADALWKIASFEKCFDIEDIAPGDQESTIGKTGFCMLGQGTNGKTGEEENTIKKFM